MDKDVGAHYVKQRCLTCKTWHLPGEHKENYFEIPETLTGQVPVSGNCSMCGGEHPINEHF